MKRLFYLILAVVLMAACNRTPVPVDPKDGGDSEKTADAGIRSYFRGSAYQGDISAMDDDLEDAI